MPGYIIHMAIAKQYAKKHNSEIRNEDEFIKGVIAPDMNEKLDGPAKDKSKTHYGKWGKYEVTTYIDKFLEDTKINMEQDFWKGYFLHLITDHYFYNKHFKEEHQEMIKNNDRFYYDYDCLNKELIEEYKLNINISAKIKKYINIYNEEPKYLKKSKIVNFIDAISNIDIQEKIEVIKEKGMEGLK